ncbi:hypothetical protein BDY21DRAFT_397470 [Lineolata rhizophorae]|uniref:Uncharacterized protein n=1 Tax=Lineolata rhizophorae TaxID=578093 RepID=A0A6A6PCW5_9PEZI|nr:hypothetical protein BDY21DRAFT_397470 [Lineolata rhizophorae]
MCCKWRRQGWPPRADRPCSLPACAPYTRQRIVPRFEVPMRRLPGRTSQPPRTSRTEHRAPALQWPEKQKGRRANGARCASRLQGLRRRRGIRGRIARRARDSTGRGAPVRGALAVALAGRRQASSPCPAVSSFLERATDLRRPAADAMPLPHGGRRASWREQIRPTNQAQSPHCQQRERPGWGVIARARRALFDLRFRMQRGPILECELLGEVVILRAYDLLRTPYLDKALINDDDVGCSRKRATIAVEHTQHWEGHASTLLCICISPPLRLFEPNALKLVPRFAAAEGPIYFHRAYQYGGMYAHSSSAESPAIAHPLAHPPAIQGRGHRHRQAQEGQSLGLPPLPAPHPVPLGRSVSEKPASQAPKPASRAHAAFHMPMAFRHPAPRVIQHFVPAAAVVVHWRWRWLGQEEH